MPSKRYPSRGKDASQSNRQERVGIAGAFAAVLLSEETGEDEDDPGEASEDEEDEEDLVAYHGGDALGFESKVVGVLSPRREITDLFA